MSVEDAHLPFGDVIVDASTYKPGELPETYVARILPLYSDSRQQFLQLYFQYARVHVYASWIVKSLTHVGLPKGRNIPKQIREIFPPEKNPWQRVEKYGQVRMDKTVGLQLYRETNAFIQQFSAESDSIADPDIRSQREQVVREVRTLGSVILADFSVDQYESSFDKATSHLKELGIYPQTMAEFKKCLQGELLKQK